VRAEVGERAPPFLGAAFAANLIISLERMDCSEWIHPLDALDGARANLTPVALGYFETGAGDEHALRANAAAFSRWEFKPRVMRDVSVVRLRPKARVVHTAHA